MALKSAILKQPLKYMNKKALILTVATLALCACKSPYSDWEMPNVVRNNKPQPAKKAQETSRSSQVQPQFEKPKATPPAPTQQIQPEFKKPEPVVAPAPKPEQQIQPKLEKPEPVVAPAPKPEQQIQPKLEKPEPVATPAPKPVHQIQPELKKTEPIAAPVPAPVATPAPKPEPKKVSVAETKLPNTQVQPTFTQPKQQSGSPRPVMTKAQKEQDPVMPGQNRALKRRR